MGAWRSSEGAGRASEGAGMASEGAGSASEGTGRASEGAGRVSDGAGRAPKGTRSCRTQGTVALRPQGVGDGGTYRCTDRRMYGHSYIAYIACLVVL